MKESDKYHKGVPYQYCCQCRDRNTGVTGCFIHEGDFKAISPVVPSLVEIFEYMDANGLVVSKEEKWYCHVKIGIQVN
jgi:hypothetical protein